MSINDRISSLRNYMAEHHIDAYIIPSTDPHQSEYVASHWKGREWISGFTGSAGVVVVTHDHAGVWTDSRYFIQAEEELASSEFELHKVIKQGAPMHELWLAETLTAGHKVAFDASLFSVSQVRALRRRLEKHDITIHDSIDLLQQAWQDRPVLPTEPIFEHDLRYTGESRADKLHRVRVKMKAAGADQYFISTLDDIAWLFNIRGRDVACNPVAIAYAIIKLDSARLFIDQQKVSAALRNSLLDDKVQLSDYHEIQAHLESISLPTRILIHKASCNADLYQSIHPDTTIKAENIVMHMKAVKNEVELSHFREVMKKDAVALTKLYMWLEQELKQRAVPEAELAEQLITFRAEGENYYGESFDAIVGYQGNGAIVHYRAEHSTCADIKNEGMLLLDSGGQYTDGTTDITRTVTFSEPTAEQRTAYTAVLQGHIALAQAKFPEGTIGGQLDALARQFLWQHGLNYLHGTGHGVGFFLNVHEPPQGFAPGLSTRSNTTLVPGMVTSNEPGYYKEGDFGIRIENLIITKHADEPGYLDFETITLFPIDTRLIDQHKMSPEQIDWLNDYHHEVEEKLRPHLSIDQQRWMKQKCLAIAK